MPSAVTINRAEVVALIQTAANVRSGGNKTEAVALAMRSLLERDVRGGGLFGAHPGSVRVREGVGLVAPSLQNAVDRETRRQLER
jgi:hypothetical protein